MASRPPPPRRVFVGVVVDANDADEVLRTLRGQDRFDTTRFDTIDGVPKTPLFPWARALAPIAIGMLALGVALVALVGNRAVSYSVPDVSASSTVGFVPSNGSETALAPEVSTQPSSSTVLPAPTLSASSEPPAPPIRARAVFRPTAAPAGSSSASAPKPIRREDYIREL